MTEVKKIVPKKAVKKTASVIKITPKTAPPTKKEVLAKILLTLPKEGKTADEIQKECTINVWDVPMFLSFAISLGIIKKEGDKFFKV